MPEKKQTILIIDDSSVNNILLENILQDEGYNVQVAFNANEAMAYIREQKPHLILLDIMMPGKNGYDILQDLRKDESTKNIPVVMVSAKSYTEDIEKAKILGANDYIAKPINIRDIVAKIEKNITPL